MGSAETLTGRSAPAGGSVRVVERLLEAGCSRIARDAHGNQPWHAAAEAAQLDVMRLLRAKGCTWELRNNSGWTALHYAAHAGGCCCMAPHM